MRDSAVFDVDGLTFHYPGAARPAVVDVSFRVPPGSFHAALGPNGSGKSTLLRLLAGALEPEAGSVLYRGRPVGAWDRRELARRVAVVPQFEEPAFPMRVREFVGMGRYPHLGGWQSERAKDRCAIAEAMVRCEVTELAHRRFRTLSGGERQRARIARALAQEPETLVLDEPTASLDIHHEMAIFGLLDGLAASDGVTVFLVTHNINLAARFAKRLLLLDDGRLAARGSPREVIRRNVLEGVYRWPVAVERHPGPGADEGAPQVVPLSAESARSDPEASRESSPDPVNSARESRVHAQNPEDV